ncbi:hypothetical protein AB0D83_26650 [Streptomyces decoyicus]|uniref:hypothetical protein n=1 Tax=Streptomyces decoyicus TaxID=249567 RepID=UPI0033FCB61E
MSSMVSSRRCLRTAAIATLVVLTAGACGSEPEPAKGTPVTRPKAPALDAVAPQHPAPGEKAPVLEKIKYELETRVLRMGGMVPKPTSSSCDTDAVGDKPQKFTCNVTYLGIEVPFRVDTTGGFIMTQYTATPLKGGVITGEGVRATAWKRYGTLGGKTRDSLRCDDIPTVRLVPVDKPSGYRCYVGAGGLAGSYDVIIGANGLSLR